MADLLANPKICGACSTPACELKCACKLVFYCGAVCQRKHWPEHKQVCTVALAKKIRKARREHGKDDFGVVKARMDAANALRQQGRFKDAERCFLEARGICVRVEGEGNANVGEVSRVLGDMYGEMGRHDDAMKELEEGLQIARIKNGERSREAAAALQCIGKVASYQGKNEESLARMEEAHSILREAVGADHPDVGAILSFQGTTYARMGRPAEALAAVQEALRIQ